VDQRETAAEQVLRRERALVGTCLVLICLLSWYYLLTGAGTGMDVLAMTTWQFPPTSHAHAGSTWHPTYWVLMATMWWLMMIAMMLPSAAPVVLLYARVQRHNWRRAGLSDALVPTLAFVMCYLLCWLLFSLLATVLQWWMERLGLVHGMLMWSSSQTLSGGILELAGAYQISPLKNACLGQCRSPAAYLAQQWRKGRIGALAMGWTHGLYCVGCCWVMMLLLFVGGIMNLVWIAGLTLLVLLEKLWPLGDRLAQLSGVVMFGTGLWVLVSAATGV
jgi:predicted metal-binding membrane protein